MQKLTADAIDALLPQTQCGLCGYKGCMPYAKAIAYENVPIDLCPPGGVETLKELAALTHQDPTPFIAAMELKKKPPSIVMIREEECIGCTKCIQACPVDAILGSAKQMHTVIASECTGCELCIPPCPVDCIEIITFPEKSAEDKKQKSIESRQRFLNRELRLTEKKSMKKTESLTSPKDYIKAAILRAKAKKLSSK